MTIERLVSFSMAPLRPNHLPLAPHTLGGGSKRDEFGNDRLRSWGERIEKQSSWQKPKVDRSGEH
jgi:hypothetical protein